MKTVRGVVKGVEGFSDGRDRFGHKLSETGAALAAESAWKVAKDGSVDNAVGHLEGAAEEAAVVVVDAEVVERVDVSGGKKRADYGKIKLSMMEKRVPAKEAGECARKGERERAKRFFGVEKHVFELFGWLVGKCNVTKQ